MNRERPLRILVGTREISGMISDFARGLRKLGHHVTTAVRDRQDIFGATEYDLDLSREILRTPSWVRGHGVLERATSRVERYAQFSRAISLALSHDVFFFQWSTLWPGPREFPALKAAGKRIVSIFVGSDVRHWTAYGQEYGVALEKLDRCFLETRINSNLFTLRHAEFNSDVVLSQPNQSGLALRPYAHLSLPIDLRGFWCHIPRNTIPIVVHAPTHKAGKGTDHIIRVLERLGREGVRFELRLLHKVPNTEVRGILQTADVVVDQLYLPMHGKLGVEAMASGCALATCNRQDLDAFPPDRPICHVDEQNLYEPLKELLTNAELRTRLAVEGRRYVERYHDDEKVAARALAMLRGDVSRDEHFPTFFATKYQLPSGVTISDEMLQLSTKVVRRWGLPDGVEPADLAARGLIADHPSLRKQQVPRWSIPHTAPAV